MNFLVQAILPYVLLYKYWALFIFTFLASLAVPIPAGSLLIASSAFASQGYFSMIKILIIVVFANIMGDNLSYWLARLYGMKVLSRVKFFQKMFLSKDFILIEKNIKKHPGLLIVFTRFEVLSTLTANLICGISKVNYRKFMVYEALGAIASVLFYAFIGYSFGDSWQAVDKVVGNFSIIFFLAITLVVSFFWKKIISMLNKNT